ncbi:hypothetical protein [Pasteurella multocida]|uniref:hypothetical protein n=1 Tax=Pasteurella multocida TaxID=747 RepID=UPI00061A6195|nr:hypothetical protein [Pasteurella multocida]AKD40906.1 hypothetical protein I927_08475 [Pasteurella multocida OH1905]
MKNLIRLISFYLNLSRRAYITHKLQKFYAWKKPIKPYAFIRVCNEIKTIHASLHSILPCVKGGVIGFNSCTDGSKEYILDFCKKHPQFTPVEYPYDVIPGCDERYKENNIPLNNRLDTYYNFVWEKLPKEEWIIKIDADHIWLPKYLTMLCKLPLRKKDFIILNRINIHCENNTCYINKENPMTEVGDSWILYNSGNIKFKFQRGWNDENTFFAWEYLPQPKRNRIYGVLANFHFPIVKSQRSVFDSKQWIKIKDFDSKEFIIKNKMHNRIPEEFLDEKFILENFNKFNENSD